MSIANSRSTLASSNVNMDDKAKLISLIRTWRSKYDKVNALALHSRDVIASLKNDVERLAEEKDAETNHLSAELQNEKEEGRRLVEEMGQKAAEYEAKAASEKQALIDKLTKMKLLLLNATSDFKTKGEEMTKKIQDMTQSIAVLEEENLRNKEEKEKSMEECKRRVEEVSKLNDELKNKYKEKVGELQEQMAVQIAEIRGKAEEKIQNLRGDLRSEIVGELDKEREKKKLLLQATRKAIEGECEVKLRSLDERHQFSIRNLMTLQAEETKTLQKKLELANIRLRKRIKDSEMLSKSLKDARLTLKTIRKAMPGSVYTEMFLDNEKRNLTTTATSTSGASAPEAPRRSMRSLLDDLALRMRELRDLRKALERQDQQENKILKEGALQEDLLKLEIQHNGKVIEAEQLKKQIRQRQLEFAYKGTRAHNPVPPPQETPDAPPAPYFVMNRPSTSSSTGKARYNVAKRYASPATKRKQSATKRPEKAKESERGSWLTRRNSTVQFNPTPNARNVWHRPDLLQRLKFQANGFVNKS